MRTLHRGLIGDRIAVAVVTDSDDGDVHPGTVEPGLLRRRQLAVAGRRWGMVDEVHGVALHDLDGATQPRWPLAAEADVLVTARPGVPLAVWAADCAPLALFGAGGTTVVAHVGWRGLVAGVVDVAVNALARRGDEVDLALVGPLIHPCCYEFGDDELRSVAAALGVDPARVSGYTREGSPALDMPAAVGLALARHGLDATPTGPCTGCDTSWYSHRRRRDVGRHALVAWTETPAAGRDRSDRFPAR